ncbi:efflux RND transporter permease subunit [Pseudomaricurvus sp. HS19]|uniref:efflux RND transporter permease subunit n=1 Tax=Pseudomaricurvus sp. HS19 TaxID=2692626 RepID=UPI001367F296|nr:efflux RND transporter permease subunit [Pseudomaricurvus sp. HS19]MYM64111.1 MMPL family transporter [Pseudomaricurvus sp. HS19]
MFEAIIKRGILTTVVVLIVCVLGILAATRIPVQMIPDLDVRVISIRTIWPGATPQDVEKEILIEQEEYLRTLPNLSRIEATASTGMAEIELEFPFGTDITEMLIRVNNALSQVPSYPEAVDQPRIYANSFSSNPFMFFGITPLPGNPKQLDMDLMLDFIEDNVKTRMSQVQGVSEIALRGGAERQIQILVDPARLAQRQLSLSDVRDAIRKRNRDRSGGDIKSGKRQFLLRTVGRFEDMEELQQLILARRGDAIIRLQDVATVQLDHFEKSASAFYNGDPNIFVMSMKDAGANVIDIKRDMLAEVALINHDVLQPAGMQITHIADDVHYVEESVANVWQNLALGSLLAIGVMFLFLRSLRTTAIGVMGIPICIIVAFFGLLVMGRTINVISLAGIAFAIGMTLDNSIVVLESIELELRRGLNRVQAAVAGVKNVWPAVFASTMTTVLVFLPVAFVKEEAGQLYSDIAIAISSAILASMLVAITILPTAAARLKHLLPEENSQPNGRAHQLGLWLRAHTLDGVHWLVADRKRRFTCIGITVVISAAIIALLTPPAEYLPEGEEPKVFATMSAPPGYNLDTMQEIGDELQAYFLNYTGTDPQAFRRGDDPVPSIKYFNVWVYPFMVRVIAEPTDAADIEAFMDALTAKFLQYPGMRAFAARGSIITSNDGGTRSINLDIAGPDLETIFSVAMAAYRRAGEVFDNPRIQTSPNSLTMAQPMVEIRPHWQRAAEVGLSAEELGFTVSALTDGSYVDEFFLGDDKIDIYLYSTVGQDAQLESLPQLPIYTPNGTILPLSALAEIRESVDTAMVRRVNGNRTVTLNIIPPRSVALESGVGIVRTEVVSYLRDQGQIPAGVSISISGAADQLDATRSALTSNYLVALFIIYLLLVAIFSHWGYPLLIMTSIPLGIAGGIVGLWLLNAVGGLLPWVGLAAIVQPFDMISMLGFLILMGTVVNNPILIVHRAVENVRDNGMDAIAAVNEAVDTRLRPITMSTITTLFGLAPLVLIPGAGTELYRGVGAIVMFGIIGATVVTLTMLPALTAAVLEYMQRRQKI